MTVDTLDTLLAPITAETYLRDYWTKQFLHVRGASDKFAHLFPWQTLNSVLEEHRFEPGRLVLYKLDEKIESQRYMSGSVLNTRRLARELADGASLIVNACEELWAPLRNLCTELERVFDQRAFANLYAAWRQHAGFGAHWDTQNTIILQVFGRKRWMIWEPTRSNPFREDVVDTSKKTRPAGPPLYDILLEPGDLLSVPRGWWHDVIPVNEPTLHLTISFDSRSGIDLLHWMADAMKRSDAARREVPALASLAEQAAWLEEVRGDFERLWRENPVGSFLGHDASVTPPRPQINLPSQVSSLMPSAPSEWIQLAGPRKLRFVYEGSKARCQVAGVDWQMDSESAKRMEILNDHAAHHISKIAADGSKALVLSMVMGGVLRYTVPPETLT